MLRQLPENEQVKVRELAREGAVPGHPLVPAAQAQAARSH